jgi:hypothetical protein
MEKTIRHSEKEENFRLGDLNLSTTRTRTTPDVGLERGLTPKHPLAFVLSL